MKSANPVFRPIAKDFYTLCNLCCSRNAEWLKVGDGVFPCICGKCKEKIEKSIKGKALGGRR